MLRSSGCYLALDWAPGHGHHLSMWLELSIGNGTFSDPWSYKFGECGSSPLYGENGIFFLVFYHIVLSPCLHSSFLLSAGHNIWAIIIWATGYYTFLLGRFYPFFFEQASSTNNKPWITWIQFQKLRWIWILWSPCKAGLLWWYSLLQCSCSGSQLKDRTFTRTLPLSSSSPPSCQSLFRFSAFLLPLPEPTDPSGKCC